MARKSPQIATLLVVAGTGACAGERGPAGAPPRVIEVKDASGAVTLALAVAADRCTVSGATDLAVVRHEAQAVATMGTSTILTLGPGRTGTEVIDADGTTRLRLIEQPGQLDLVTLEGVAVAKISATADHAFAVDAGRRQLVELRPDGAQLVVTPADGSPAETITGTDDLVVATVLAVPGVPPDVRALIACARALPTANSTANPSGSPPP